MVHSNPEHGPGLGRSPPPEATRPRSTPAEPPAREVPPPAIARIHGPPSPAEIECARLEALVELLDDDSPSVVLAARRMLEGAGKLANGALRHAGRDPRARLRARARAVTARREQVQVMRRLFRHATRPVIDLERALFLLGRLDRFDLDCRPFVATLNAMAAEVARRAIREEHELTRLMVLPQYLGNEMGFIGSEVDFEHPDNIHLHRVLERKRGMPLVLTAIYMFVARRAGMRAAAIPMPGRVLLRLHTSRRSLIVDPFAGGRLRTHADCVRYLAEHRMVPRPEWFRNATDDMLFARHVRNLMNSAQMRGLDRRAHELARLARLLGRTHAVSQVESPRT